MDEPERVDVVERARELNEDVDDRLARLALEVVAQIDAFDQLLGEEHALDAIAAAELVDRREVGVVQLRQQPELVLERLGDVVAVVG